VADNDILELSVNKTSQGYSRNGHNFSVTLAVERQCYLLHQRHINDVIHVVKLQHSTSAIITDKNINFTRWHKRDPGSIQSWVYAILKTLQSTR